MLHKTTKTAGKNCEPCRRPPASSSRVDASKKLAAIRKRIDESPHFEPVRQAQKRAGKNRIVVAAEQRGNVTYQCELVKCGKPKCSRCRRRPAHGPYWYGYWRSWSKGGRVVSKYIGKVLRVTDGEEHGWQ